MISNDVKAFKTIRHRLFLQANQEGVSPQQTRENKLYLYMFHLFESVINNVTMLVQKSSSNLIQQCDIQESYSNIQQNQGQTRMENKNTGEKDDKTQKDPKEKQSTSKDDKAKESAQDKEVKGYFSKNIKSLLECKQRIDETISSLQDDIKKSEVLVANSN